MAGEVVLPDLEEFAQLEQEPLGPGAQKGTADSQSLDGKDLGQVVVLLMLQIGHL